MLAQRFTCIPAVFHRSSIASALLTLAAGAHAQEPRMAPVTVNARPVVEEIDRKSVV